MKRELYPHSEYKEKQIELDGKNELLKKLDSVYRGLEGVINAVDDGLLSFKRLLGIDNSEDIHYFDGKTVFQALTDENVSIEQLKILKDYGKIFSSTGKGAVSLSERAIPNGEDLQRVGRLIYMLAIAQAFNKYEEKISTYEDENLKIIFDELSVKPYVVRSVKEIFDKASGYLTGRHGSDLWPKKDGNKP